MRIGLKTKWSSTARILFIENSNTRVKFFFLLMSLREREREREREKIKFPEEIINLLIWCRVVYLVNATFDVLF